MKKDWFCRILISVLAVLCFLPARISLGDEPVQVAVIPLQINAADRLEYLQNGLLDIMASRLAWEGRVAVLDRDTVQQALSKFPGTVDEAFSRRMGKDLGVRYVLFGSLTMVGAGASIDLRVTDLTREQPAEKFFAETRGLDEIIPRMDDLLEDINVKVFDRPRTAAAPPRRTAGGTGPSAVPGQKTGGIDLKDYTLRPLSPQIIMNAGGFDLAGIWRSSILPYALRDLDFGDLDGDGYLETVIISQQGIHIYRFKDDKFNLLTEIKGQRNDNYISVDVADINGTGRPQIFVSNFRDHRPQSLVLAWEGEGVKTIARQVDYSLRVHQWPGRGQVLLGQQRRGNDPFGSRIKVLAWKEGRYAPQEELDLPEELNVFNFVTADLNRDGSPETVYINKNNKLVVLSAKGKVEYESGDHFGGTISYLDLTEFNAVTSTIMSDREARTYLPARLVVKPGKSSEGPLEIIVNRNKDSLWNVIDRFESFSSGIVYSLSWEGTAFKENWRTMTINDYLANYGVADFRNNKQKQLVVGIVQSRGLPVIGNARSLLYCYDLGVVQFEKK